MHSLFQNCPLETTNPRKELLKFLILLLFCCISGTKNKGYFSVLFIKAKKKTTFCIEIDELYKLWLSDSFISLQHLACYTNISQVLN